MSSQNSHTHYGGYDPNEGLANFQNYYARQSGIPGPFRPRPGMLHTPVFTGRGLEGLHRVTENLPYYSGVAAPGYVPLTNDEIIGTYDLGKSKKENCGCGVIKLP